MTDEREGDAHRRLVETWHRLYSERIEAFVRGLTRNAEISAEVTQTVFIKAIENCPDALSELDAPKEDADGYETEHSDVRAWLFTVARNETLTRLRRLGVEKRGLRKLSIPPPKRAADEDLRLIRQERAAALKSAVAELNEKERWLLKRHYDDGATFAEIAEECGEPLGTVLSRAHRTIAKLRSKLRNMNDE